MAARGVAPDYRAALRDVVWFLEHGRPDLAIAIARYALELVEQRRQAAAERRARNGEATT